MFLNPDKNQTLDLSLLSHQDLKSPTPSGLIQIISCKGGPAMSFAMDCFQEQFAGLPSPSSPSYSLFVSDEGTLYAPGLQRWKVSLSHWVVVKAENAAQVWKVVLEALQTGLFRHVFARPSQTCHPSHLRKLQLLAEKTKSLVFLLCRFRLPHWNLKSLVEVSYEKDGSYQAHPLLSKPWPFGSLERSASLPYSQSLPR